MTGLNTNFNNYIRRLCLYDWHQQHPNWIFPAKGISGNLTTLSIIFFLKPVLNQNGIGHTTELVRVLQCLLWVVHISFSFSHTYTSYKLVSPPRQAEAQERYRSLTEPFLVPSSEHILSFISQLKGSPMQYSRETKGR